MTFHKAPRWLGALVGAMVSVGVVGGPSAAEKPVHWKMASPLPSSVVLLGTAAKRFPDVVAAISGGEFQIKYHEPGALVPPLEMFDAVSKGSIDVAWSPPGFWAGKTRAAPIFSSVPFGPSAGEYLAWLYHGGGREIWQDILARSNIHSVFCSISAPEASGWFKQEITSLDDLKGLKMRFFGLGARVMGKLGVSTQLLAPPDIFPALESGVIDATEFSMPAVDLNIGFHQIAQHYYLPGWHQQFAMTDVMINMDRWQELSDTRKAQIEVACGNSITESLAAAEAAQFKALQELQDKGVQLHRWSPEMLAGFEAAWVEVAAELVAEDADFALAWESLSTFRQNYKIWKDLGYLD